MADRIHFIRKLTACITLSLLLTGTILLTGTPPRPISIPDTVIFGFALLGLIIPLAGLPVWQYRERKRLMNSSAVYTRIQSCIAYLTGFCISLFGWKKLFHLQFRTPLSIADLPMSQLDGETLTWYYFGHSYTFACIIGLIQITGACLLFFQRTRITAALLLFPVMLNILLINIFYHMNGGALLQSILLTLGLLYILFQEYPALILFLFPARPASSSKRTLPQWMAPIAITLTGFLYISQLKHRLLSGEHIYGRYEVTNIYFDGRPLSMPAYGNKDSILTRVYFDLDNVCVLEYNSQNRRLLARYTLEKSTTASESWTINARFENKGTLNADISPESKHQLYLRGQFAGTAINIHLLKTKD
jgi:hypothetical protein